jgi:outer membrane biosynthesis protein TonB
MFRSVGRRLVSSLVLGFVFLATSVTAHAGDDDELEKILQQGLKEIDGGAKEKQPEAKKEAKKEEKKAEAKPEPTPVEPKPEPVKPVEAKKEPVKPVESKPVETKRVVVEPKKEVAPEPVRTPVKTEPAAEEPTAEQPAPAAKPKSKATAQTTAAPDATPSKPIEVANKSAQPVAAQGDSKDPKQKRTVSMAINADQAALSGVAAKAWSINLNLSTGVGSGAMIVGGSDYAKNPYVGQQLTIEPAYVFTLSQKMRLRVSVRETFDWEFTRVDNNSARYFNWSDISVNASSRLVQIPVVGIDVFAALRMPIPISLESQHQTLVTALAPAVGLAKNFDIPVKGDYHMNLNIRYDLGFRKNFHRFVTPLVSAESNNGSAPLAIRSGTDPFIDGNLTRGGATNVSHTVSNAVTISFTPQDLVTLSVFAQLVNGFKYAGQEQLVADEFTSPNARLGAGRLETIRSNIDLTISPTSYLWISAGIFTAQPVFAPDNKTINNPFWNQQSAANNYSQLYLSIGGQI